MEGALISLYSTGDGYDFMPVCSVSNSSSKTDHVGSELLDDQLLVPYSFE